MKTVSARHFRPRNHLHAGKPWQVVAIDFCGPLLETERGNAQILVLADHFTRWYDAIPIPNGAIATVAHMLDEINFSYFGIPEQIYSDQGRQFESDLLQECCHLWGCEKSWTTPYHPKATRL